MRKLTAIALSLLIALPLMACGGGGEITEEGRQDYQVTVREPMEKFIETHNLIKDNGHSSIANATDIYSAYEGLANSAKASKSNGDRLSEIDAPDYLSKDQKELFRTAKSDLGSGATGLQTAFQDLAKAVDQADLGPATLREYQDMIAWTDAKIASGQDALEQLNQSMEPAE